MTSRAELCDVNSSSVRPSLPRRCWTSMAVGHWRQMSSAKDEHRCQCQSYPEIILILIFILILYYTIIYSTILNLYFFSIIQQCTRHGFGVTQRRKSSPWCAPVLRSSEAHVWLHEVGLIFETSGGCIEAPFQKLVKQRELCHHSYPYHRSPWALNSAMRPEPRLKTFVDSAWDLSKTLVNLQKT